MIGLAIRSMASDDPQRSRHPEVPRRLLSPPGSETAGTPDLTAWLVWFLKTLKATLLDVLAPLAKDRFWQRFRSAGLLPEQVEVLNSLLEGGERSYEHGISASQYRKSPRL